MAVLDATIYGDRSSSQVCRMTVVVILRLVKVKLRFTKVTEEPFNPTDVKPNYHGFRGKDCEAAQVRDSVRGDVFYGKPLPIVGRVRSLTHVDGRLLKDLYVRFRLVTQVDCVGGSRRHYPHPHPAITNRFRYGFVLPSRQIVVIDVTYIVCGLSRPNCRKVTAST